jgi:hypothetical protein
MILFLVDLGLVVSYNIKHCLEYYDETIYHIFWLVFVDKSFLAFFPFASVDHYGRKKEAKKIAAIHKEIACISLSSLACARKKSFSCPCCFVSITACCDKA